VICPGIQLKSECKMVTRNGTRNRILQFTYNAVNSISFILTSFCAVWWLRCAPPAKHDLHRIPNELTIGIDRKEQNWEHDSSISFRPDSESNRTAPIVSRQKHNCRRRTGKCPTKAEAQSSGSKRCAEQIHLNRPERAPRAVATRGGKWSTRALLHTRACLRAPQCTAQF
jgi:hypothetical protein